MAAASIAKLRRKLARSGPPEDLAIAVRSLRREQAAGDLSELRGKAADGDLAAEVVCFLSDVVLLEVEYQASLAPKGHPLAPGRKAAGMEGK